jgi:hypothetical protein
MKNDGQSEDPSGGNNQGGDVVQGMVESGSKKKLEEAMARQKTALDRLNQANIVAETLTVVTFIKNNIGVLVRAKDAGVNPEEIVTIIADLGYGHAPWRKINELIEANRGKAPASSGGKRVKTSSDLPATK